MHLIFHHADITSFAWITSPIEMYILTFLGSYAMRYMVELHQRGPKIL